MRRPTYLRRAAAVLACLAAGLAAVAGCIDDSRERLAILRVTPPTGTLAGGTAITIEGRGFDGDTTVEFFFAGEAPPTLVLPSPVLVSSRILTTVTPELPATFSTTIADVVLRRGGDVVTLSGGYGYTTLPPTLSSVTPSTGPAGGGTAVTVAGSGFLSGVTVTFGGVAATSVVRVDPNTITCDTPAGAAGTADVTVINPDTNSATLPGAFTYVGPPAPTAATPSGGPTVGGTRLTITGGGFQTGATVTINGVAATEVIVSAASIICTVPGYTGSTTPPVATNIVVTNPDSQAGTLNSGFTYRTSRLYVAHTGTPNTLGIVTFTDSNASLTAGTPVSTGGNGAPALAAYADGTFPDGVVYVANRSSDTIAAFTINSSGTPTAVSGSPFSMQGSSGPGTLLPARLLLHSPAIGVLVLYALNDAGSVSTFTVNTSTGALTELSAAQSPIAYNTTVSGTPTPSDWLISGAKMYIADNGRDLIAVLTIQSTGQPTTPAVVQPAANTGPTILHAWPGGQFLYTSNTGSSGNTVGAWQVSPSPPLTSIGSPAAAGTFPLGMADDAVNLFVANAGSNNITPFAVNGLSGALTAGTNATAGTTPTYLQNRAQHLYALNLGSADVSGYTIGLGGTLTALNSGVAYTLSGAGTLVTWAWAADRVFVLDGTQVFQRTRSATTGDLQVPVSPATSSVTTGGSAANDLLLSR